MKNICSFLFLLTFLLYSSLKPLAESSFSYSFKPSSQENYFKKTISRPNKVYSFAKQFNLSPADQDIALAALDSEFQTKRFFSASIPDSILKEFDTSLNNEPSLSVEQIQANLNVHIAAPILGFLNQNSTKKEQLLSQLDDNTLSLVSTKGKSIDVTIKDIKRFMNSSFFYFPYIDNASLKKEIFTYKNFDNEKVKKKRFTYKLSGGLIWFQLKADQSGQYFFENIDILTQSQTSVETVDIDDSDSATVAKLKKRSWGYHAKLLAYKTSLLKYFRVYGDILSQNGRYFDLDISNAQGVKRDDYYFGMENFEDENGTVSEPEKVSLIRVTTLKNKDNNTTSVRGVHTLGSMGSMPSWVLEDPRLNIEGSLGFARVSNFQISPSDTDIGQPIISKPITNALCLNYNAQYNLVEFTNTSQFFITLDGFLGMTESESSLFASIFIGVTKKYWYRSINTGLNVAFGETNVIFNPKNSFYDSFKLRNQSLKLTASFEKLITSDISITTEFTQNIPLSSPTATGSGKWTSFSTKASSSHLDFSALSIAVRYFM